MTRHAACRVQQRSIPASIIDALLDFGERHTAGSGTETCFFTKRSRQRFATYLGQESRHFERYRSVYAVVSAHGEVITASWRH
ncbi:MAG: hypothetical protein WC804_06950 [Sphingomonas sp.]|jgi:hypothetical protein|uniref:hypothetical protein n=1 Tax=Sphingomonas sp. TaxID=28214 RepID=UPI00356157E6